MKTPNHNLAFVTLALLAYTSSFAGDGKTAAVIAAKIGTSVVVGTATAAGAAASVIFTPSNTATTAQEKEIGQKAEKENMAKCGRKTYC